ncbi:hypothetical protein RI129_002709 [Pyrocoelia pectoralis]|uniref:Retrotransposon gag domain-containing protein n=1 Tax=Pyrocoelia pectoralis TaxID=417401 RepID=A0AAN7VH10_9COLE
MQNRLTGLARTWYDNLTTYTYNWGEWKSLIVKTFPDHVDFAATLRQLVNRDKQRNETMTQYYFGKMTLIQACNITKKNAVSCLIDGLKDRTLRNGAKAGRYDTPEDLYTEYLSTLDNDETITPLNETRENGSRSICCTGFARVDPITKTIRRCWCRRQNKAL